MMAQFLTLLMLFNHTNVGVMASVLVTSFVSLWRSCTVPHWVRSGSFELLLCYVCVGYAGQGLTEDGVSIHRNMSEQHLMCDLVYTV